MSTSGRLAALLDAGEFVVTGEAVAPASGEPGSLRQVAAGLRAVVDAANVTDNHTARVRISPLAGALVVAGEGVEPVMQLTCRDRNRLALAADLLGGHALGVRAVLCMGGDPMSVGPYPMEAEVRDVDPVGLMAIAEALGEGRAPDGSTLEQPAQFLIGAAESPAADASGGARLAAKVAAGARFVQTQPVFELTVLRGWLERLGEIGVLDKAAILAGIMPPRSARQLERLSGLPGWQIPDEVIARLKGAADPQAEGIAIAVELVAALRALPGVRGVHLMGIGHEEAVPEVVRQAGLLPRPSPN